MTPVQFMILAQVVIFLLGWPLEWTEIIVIFMPIFIPLLDNFGVDPLFFGLLVALSYYLLSEMAKAVKDPAFRPDLLVWLPNLIVLALAVVLLRRASRH